MILGREKINELALEKKLLEDFDVVCLEGAGYDLRINRIYKLKNGGFIGAKDRKTPDVAEIGFDKYSLKPGEYVLIETLEKVNMPSDVAARILPRSSLFRCGCSLITALVDPGYRGVLIMGLKNLSDFEFVVERGARVAQIVFERVEGETRSYDGRYQGGKVV
jgi:deoxycytidine triphosphate deaminase